MLFLQNIYTQFRSCITLYEVPESGGDTQTDMPNPNNLSLNELLRKIDADNIISAEDNEALDSILRAREQISQETQTEIQDMLRQTLKRGMNVRDAGNREALEKTLMLAGFPEGILQNIPNEITNSQRGYIVRLTTNDIFGDGVKSVPQLFVYEIDDSIRNNDIVGYIDKDSGSWHEYTWQFHTRDDDMRGNNQSFVREIEVDELLNIPRVSEFNSNHENRSRKSIEERANELIRNNEATTGAESKSSGIEERARAALYEPGEEIKDETMPQPKAQDEGVDSLPTNTPGEIIPRFPEIHDSPNTPNCFLIDTGEFRLEVPHADLPSCKKAGEFINRLKQLTLSAEQLDNGYFECYIHTNIQGELQPVTFVCTPDKIKNMCLKGESLTDVYHEIIAGQHGNNQGDTTYTPERPGDAHTEFEAYKLPHIQRESEFNSNHKSENPQPDMQNEDVKIPHTDTAEKSGDTHTEFKANGVTLNIPNSLIEGEETREIFTNNLKENTKYVEQQDNGNLIHTFPNGESFSISQEDFINLCLGNTSIEELYNTYTDDQKALRPQARPENLTEDIASESSNAETMVLNHPTADFHDWVKNGISDKYADIANPSLDEVLQSLQELADYSFTRSSKKSLPDTVRYAYALQAATSMIVPKESFPSASYTIDGIWGKGSAAAFKELQTFLTEQGYDCKGIDGKPGPNSVKALIRYIQDNKSQNQSN